MIFINQLISYTCVAVVPTMKISDENVGELVKAQCRVLNAEPIL
jgi:hypothetical protein